jgi:hypothetical protein
MQNTMVENYYFSIFPYDTWTSYELKTHLVALIQLKI